VKKLIVSGIVVAAALSLVVRLHAQQQGQGRQGGPGAPGAQAQGAGGGRQGPTFQGLTIRARDGETNPAVINGPVPRMPDGHPDFSGTWEGGGTDGDVEIDGNLKPGELTSLLTPWGRQIYDSRANVKYEEPYIYCLPMSVPRHNPYPWRFVFNYTSKGLDRIYILHETGDAGAHRVVYMDGRKHPDPDTLLPTWWGHSIGRWEGDTLVIDTVGYNDKFWMDARGTPHSEKLHTIERWTRVNYGTMIDEFTLDDPVAFTRPITMKMAARIARPGVDLMEYICAENNQIGLAGGYLKSGSPGIGGGPPNLEKK
jgi:hypothetical protein